MKKIVLSLIVMLTACAEVPQPHYNVKPGASATGSETAYNKCVAQQAEQLDDGISPANVIGRSIAAACNQEYIPFAMQFVANENQAVKNAYYKRITNDQDFAAEGPTHYVLSRRQYLKTHR